MSTNAKCPVEWREISTKQYIYIYIYTFKREPNSLSRVTGIRTHDLLYLIQ